MVPAGARFLASSSKSAGPKLGASSGWRKRSVEGRPVASQFACNESRARTHFSKTEFVTKRVLPSFPTRLIRTSCGPLVLSLIHDVHTGSLSRSAGAGNGALSRVGSPRSGAEGASSVDPKSSIPQVYAFELLSGLAGAEANALSLNRGYVPPAALASCERSLAFSSSRERKEASRRNLPACPPPARPALLALGFISKRLDTLRARALGSSRLTPRASRGMITKVGIFPLPLTLTIPRDFIVAPFMNRAMKRSIPGMADPPLVEVEVLPPPPSPQPPRACSSSPLQ
mmetsp:Transcript_44024/g.99471  ORF Transcript_44024/g.99471 Transcript_44024/m.99471 type:complete len:286 (+) Transcript_44024:593-1450(+)